MESPAPAFAEARVNMVESQIRPAEITDWRITEIMAQVPRELFAPPAQQALAYADIALRVKDETADQPARYLLEPRVFAKILQAAAIRSGERVLDIACASGYSSAVLARLTPHVTALEVDEELAAHARRLLPRTGAGAVAVVGAPLEQGHADGGPYDVIIVNGGVEFVPDALLAQLDEGGRLLCVTMQGIAGQVWLHVKHGGAVSGRAIFDTAASLLPGFVAERSFVF